MPWSTPRPVVVLASPRRSQVNKSEIASYEKYQTTNQK